MFRRVVAAAVYVGLTAAIKLIGAWDAFVGVDDDW